MSVQANQDPTKENEQQTQIVPGSDEYNAQMASKYNDAKNGTGDEADIEQPPVDITPMPENGSEKFYNKETGEYNWEGHAKDAEYRLNQGKPQDDANDPNDKDATESDAQDDEVANVITGAGLDPDALQGQLDTNGKLDDESFEALVKAGIPKQLVEAFVDSYTFATNARIQEQLAAAGGQEQFDSLKAWAEGNLTQAERDEFNQAMQSPYWKYALDDMKARHAKSKPLGNERPLINGNGVPQGSVGYRSKSEMKRDMADPRYKTDPAFRNEVMRKVGSASWDLDK